MVLLTSYHEFAVFMTAGLLAVTVLLTLAHAMPSKTDAEKKRKLFMTLVCKIANVGITVLSFFQLFVSDFHFDIADDVAEYEPTTA